MSKSNGIRPIDQASVHRITSGQVVIDLQTAVKELVENSIDAGATNIEVRFKQYGLTSVEVIDNGSGIDEKDFDSIVHVALKHHTSKLEVYEDLNTVQTFGFRGEALSSLCALCESINVTTSTEDTAPKGTSLELDFSGQVKARQVVARKRGTTVTVSKLFTPLPVRRKEFERKAKREFDKALSLLYAYALGPCAASPGVRMSVTNHTEKGQKSVQLQTQGTPSLRASVTALWGPKAMENLVELDVSFSIETEKSVLKRLKAFKQSASDSIDIHVKGLTSKFAVGCGRLNTDRQFFYINGRPCNLPKVQKAFNEVYRTFNANQAPFLVADFIIPTGLLSSLVTPLPSNPSFADSCDVNVSPDKRTILVHNEDSLITALKEALEDHFSSSRATFDLGQSQGRLTQTTLASSHTQTVAPRPTPAPSSPCPSTVAALDVPVKVGDNSQTTTSSSSDVTRLEEDADAAMDIEPDNPPQLTSTACLTPPEPSPSEQGDITLDTRLASWGGSLSSSQTQPSNTPEEQGEEDHPRKRRKLEQKEISQEDGEDDPRVSIASRTETNSRTGCSTNGSSRRQPVAKKSNLSIWSQLSTFAAPGSQLQRCESEEAGDVRDGDGDEEVASDSPRGSSIEPTQLEETPPPDDSTVAVEEPRPDTVALGEEEEEEEEEEEVQEVQLPKQHREPSISTRPESPAPSGTQSSIGTRPEILKHTDASSDVSLRFDIQRTSGQWQRLGNAQSNFLSSGKGSSQSGGRDEWKLSKDASISNADDSKASDALARVIEKGDFASMAVIGQFNLGFIIVQRKQPGSEDKPPMDDLFIVDQHAADEKYNFETLQLTTKIQAQKLLRPRPLELTAGDELLAIENLEVLRNNGFEVEMIEENMDGEETPRSQGGRLRLTAQPVSKSTVFDMKGGRLRAIRLTLS
ncbi:DNA mismatch repair protein [Coprinopsis cinerea okayama7|uniref:DNA mismatch repair protein n=1 Tax=Coprinopsis cinerea (strain Okayama-7 / 130 / ATCC MYA-4618 / FGSC 9003) TaxID=240176 RepID=A8P227_COPC7|nr:DNA mismatch repair protein [Coprinopsis cinerea okayama7\|eukprot:XP_001838229.2 DNA mismatch repair protein [Coprinopsis cinerea okayama7\